MFKKLLVLVLSLALMLSAGGMVWAAEGAGGAKPQQVVENTGSTDQEEAVENEAGEEVEEEEAEVENDGEEEKGLKPDDIPGKGFGQKFNRRGLSGLQNALERVKANGSPVAQKVLSKLIEADGDVQSIAQTLRDVTDEEIDELDEETKEQLEAAAEEAREKAEQDAEMNEESKKEVLTDVADFYKKIGSDDDTLEAFEDAVKYVPTDIKTYREIGQLYKKKGLEGVKAFINGKKPNFDVQPRVENGRTLVPFRALGEAFGALINWDAATQTVSFEKGDTLVQLPIGQTIALVNGQQYQLDVAAFIDNGRTLVPLRFIMEALNAKVDYLPDTQMVIVNEE